MLWKLRLFWYRADKAGLVVVAWLALVVGGLGVVPGSNIGDAPAVFEAVREKRFYILTHEDWKQFVRKRMNDILLGRDPS